MKNNGFFRENRQRVQEAAEAEERKKAEGKHFSLLSFQYYQNQLSTYQRVHLCSYHKSHYQRLCIALDHNFFIIALCIYRGFLLNCVYSQQQKTNGKNCCLNLNTINAVFLCIVFFFVKRCSKSQEI